MRRAILAGILLALLTGYVAHHGGAPPGDAGMAGAILGLFTFAIVGGIKLEDE